MSHTKIIPNTRKPTNNSVIAPIAASSKDVRRMLGLSLHGWENTMVLSLIIAGFFALVVGAATWAVVRLTRLELVDSKKAFDAYKLTVESNVADAKKEGIAAGKTAGNALVRAAELEKESAALKLGLADANARALEAQLALEKFKAPRWINDEQQKLLVSRLSRFQGVLVDVWLLHAPSQDAAPFAQRILSVLMAAQWKANGVFNLMGGATATGVIIVMRENPSANDRAAAAALLTELNSAGIEANLQTGVTDKPVEVLGAFAGPNASNPPSNLWVAIGSKP